MLASPFLPALTWALALAVLTHPFYSWMERALGRPNLAAALSVLAITLMLLTPIVFVVRQVIAEATAGYQAFSEKAESGTLERDLEANPMIGRAYTWVRERVDVRQELKELGDYMQRYAGRWLGGTIWTVTQLFITIFLLFYFIRDRHSLCATIRDLLPVSSAEAREVMKRARGMIHSTVFGTLVVAALQGALGGTMFWILGIPAALLWTVVMGLLSIIPILGAYIVWIPAAAVLVAQGFWVKALVLILWGSLVVGLVDNFLRPAMVGAETRMHTVTIFIAILGGLSLFGAPGLVLGPVVVALTAVFIDVLRGRRPATPSAAR